MSKTNRYISFMKKRIYNQTALFGPLYAYLVVISPPEKVKADIAKIKKELNQISDICERNLHSIAHVTLTDRLTDDSGFAGTIADLISIAQPFEIKIKGWDIFDHGHSVTVYLAIDNPGPIVKLMELVKSSSKTPHISLAKKISHQTFNTIRQYLENLDYSAEWVCADVHVLRKLMSEKHLGFKESFVLKLS